MDADLTAFLQARLDEDYRLAYVAAVDPVHGKYGTWTARHIARWDPTRVLAEVDAKRRLLALPYRDHPDCKPEWMPR
jgi:hypothetical protein